MRRERERGGGERGREGGREVSAVEEIEKQRGETERNCLPKAHSSEKMTS